MSCFDEDWEGEGSASDDVVWGAERTNQQTLLYRIGSAGCTVSIIISSFVSICICIYLHFCIAVRSSLLNTFDTLNLLGP